MAVAFNNKTTSLAKSFDHIVSGTDRILFVFAASEKVGGGFTVASYGGIGMTQVYSLETSNYGIRIWYLINPPAGSNTVNISGGGSTFTGMAVSYNGVNQNDPLGTTLSDNGTGDSTTLSPMCISVDAVVDMLYLHNAAYATSYPGTLRGTLNNGNRRLEIADKPGPTPTMYWSGIGGSYYDHISIPVRAAAPLITDVQPGSGSVLGKDTVYITGRNFIGANSVQFGESAAAFLVNNDTQIVATTPPHVAETIVVTVLTPSGSGTFNGYTFNSSLPPTNTYAIQNLRLNEPGVLYSAGSATRSGVVSARFFAPSDDGVCLGFGPRYGLILNYYQESSYDVATRLGIDQGAVTTDMSEDYGIFCIYSAHEVIWTDLNGLPGIALYYYKDGNPIRFYEVECDLPLDTWHWLKASFIDGHIQVWTRNDTDVDWILLVDTIYFENEKPWQVETFGRSGIYLENVTAHSASFPFYSNDMIIPVHDYTLLGPGLDAKCPEAEDVYCMVGLHIMVDDEVIITEGISTAVVSADDTSGMIAKEAYFNGGNIFTGYPVNIAGHDAVHPDNYYNNCALIMISGGAAGKAFKITGYDAVAPNKWVPKGTYITPDTWQAHVGDTAHGSWQASDYCIIYVSEDPSGYISYDDSTIVQIVPGLLVTSRAADSTIATTHDASHASIYSVKKVLCNWSNFFTADHDWTLESIIRYIVEGSGGKCSFSSFVDDDLTTEGTWGMSPWYGSNALSLRSFVGTFTLPSLNTDDEVGVVFHATGTATGEFSSTAYRLTIQLDSTGYWVKLQKSISGAGNFTDLERMPISSDDPEGEVLISVQDSVFSVWINNLLVASFYNADITDGYSVAFTSKTANTFHVRIGELCDFISMWAIDASSSANEVLDEIIADRRVFFADDGKGGLHFYRLRSDAGSMPDIGLTYQIGDSADVVSWTRGEGAKFIEDADASLLAQYGLRYQLVNTRWALNVDETVRFARWYRKDQEARAKNIAVEIIPHPGYQVGDFISITFPKETKIIDLIGITLKLEVNDNSITCAEQLQGTGHAVL